MNFDYFPSSPGVVLDCVSSDFDCFCGLPVECGLESKIFGESSSADEIGKLRLELDFLSSPIRGGWSSLRRLVGRVELYGLSWTG